MNISFKKCPYTILLAIASFAAFNANGSHLIGDEFSYQLIDSLRGSYHYRVTLTIYIDCLNGSPEAIIDDNPAYLSLYKGVDSLVEWDSLYYSYSGTVPSISSNPCEYLTPPDFCTQKKTFVQDYYLPASIPGYLVVYQRCCRNAALSDVSDPGDAGSTYFCSIPASGLASYNNSAVFTNEAPQFVGLGLPIYFDCSATDVDGDSLSYGFTPPLNCCTTGGIDNPKPVPSPPPFDSITYIYPFTSSSPMACSVPLQINAVTGLLTGTASSLGRYLISVYCYEWRHGTMINTTRREFEFTVVPGGIDVFHPFAGNDTSILVGDSIQFNASGAVSYAWTPSTFLSDTAIYNPVGHFTEPGVFSYILSGANDSGCNGKDTIVVNVVETSEMLVPNAFTPNGDGHNDYLKPIPVLNVTLKSFKVFNSTGSLMFSTTNIGDGWDGKYHGESQGIGSYLWELVYEDNAGVTKKMNGNVTLIR